MKESVPQFDNSTRRSPGKLAFGRDINKSVSDALSGFRVLLPTEAMPEEPLAFSHVYVCTITSAAAGQGKYRCAVYAPDGGDIADPAANFMGASANFGDAVDSTGLFINLDEPGALTHSLTDAANIASLMFLGVHIGYTDDDHMVLVGRGEGVEACATP